ncbi:tail fiber [Yersinia phage fHe-Yen8-01]|nr:tail fiber [Yersinia phage fHe-Yen8-01]
MPMEQTTKRLQMPLPYLTNPLKIDVARLTSTINMLDTNAVMLNDWDITSAGWQRLGTIKGLEQGSIAISLMIVTGNGFANVIFKSGDGSVTTVNAAGRMAVSMQTNLGLNIPTILTGKAIETSEDNYEFWVEIDPAAPPMKWTGLLIAGNGATIDWTVSAGSMPVGGFDIPIVRGMTDADVAAPLKDGKGLLLPLGLFGLGLSAGELKPAFDINTYKFHLQETIFVDMTLVTNWPVDVKPASARYCNIQCLSIDDSGDSVQLLFTTAATSTSATYYAHRVKTGSTYNWNVRKVYTSSDKPTALEIGTIPVIKTPLANTDISTLINPITQSGIYQQIDSTQATVVNGYPDGMQEAGTLMVTPAQYLNQLYIGVSGRIASRSYDGSVFKSWVITTEAGANKTITSLTALSGPLKLGGDAVSPYDAVTLRQLQANAGGSGPTMSGVMNNFIGAVDWFLGSRAKLPAGSLPGDGGLYNRADWPDLWTAINSGMLLSIEDSAWTEGGGDYHGVYTKGNGTTTFRVPDLNGVWTHPTNSGLNSYPGNFLRGDGLNSSNQGTGGAGSARANGAPNITGKLPTAQILNGYQGATGALGGTASVSTSPQVAYSTQGSGQSNLDLNAQRSHPTYGRLQGGVATNEIAPNAIKGIWIIRASGAFTAANTSFSVLNADVSTPPSGTVATGGRLTSLYQIAGVDNAKASLYSTRASNEVSHQAMIEVSVPNGGTPKQLIFDSNGDLTIPGRIYETSGKIEHRQIITYLHGTQASPPTLTIGYTNQWALPDPARIWAGRVEVFYAGEWGEPGFASNAGSGSTSYGAKLFIRSGYYKLWTGNTWLLGASIVTGGAWDLTTPTITSLPFRIVLWTIDA